MGDWYELIGSAYDRTLYAFQLPTTAEQDDAFIAKYNSRPNHESYKFVTQQLRGLCEGCRQLLLSQISASRTDFRTRHFDAEACGENVCAICEEASRIAHDGFCHSTGAGNDSSQPASAWRAGVRLQGQEVRSAAARLYIRLSAARLPPATCWAEDRSIRARTRWSFSPDGDLQAPLSSEDRKSYQKGLDEMMKANAEGDAEARRSDVA